MTAKVLPELRQLDHLQERLTPIVNDIKIHSTNQLTITIQYLSAFCMMMNWNTLRWIL